MDELFVLILGTILLWLIRERTLYKQTLTLLRRAQAEAAQAWATEKETASHTWATEKARLTLDVANAQSRGDILQARLTTSEEEAKLHKGRAASAHTTRGQLLEKWAPFVSAAGIDPAWKPKDWHFLGAPIDYAVFHWFSQKKKNAAEGKIVLLDVKSGKATLSTKQRRIKELIELGKVEWREIRLS